MNNSQLSNFIVFSLLLLLSLSKTSAAHIIGGDMTYRCIEVDSINQFTIFEIAVTMYRDSEGGGADFDDPARFGVYKGSGNNWELIGGTIRRRPQSTQELNNVDNPCITIPPNVGVESAKYTFELQLDWIDENYKVAYQRCCRNNTISNLLSPQSTGAVFEIDITPEAQRSCNNSPTFNKLPPIVLCAGETVNVDISGTDLDGDQILYEFCTPKSSGGQMMGNGCEGVIPEPPECLPPFGNAVFLLPDYTVDRPLGPDAQTSLDPNSGILTITPNVLGQFVVGVCIKEFRNGQIISEVSRDFQFNIAPCTNLVKADLETNDTVAISDILNGVINVESCFVKDIQFENRSSSLIGTPNYLWEFISFGDTIRDNSESPTITFPDIGTFNGVLIVNPEAGVCSDTANISVTIHPELIADFSYDYDTCIAGPVEFYDNSKVQGALIDQWKWALTHEDSTDTQNPIYRFETPGIKNVSLIINDSNECTDTITKEIIWLPVPDVLLVEPSEFEGCVPATIDFNNLSSPIDDTYMINWSFGDGTTDSLLSPSHTYLTEGVYDVLLQIISPEGCEISRLYPELISIFPEPKANFNFEPKTTTILNPIVSFSDSSNYVNGHQWYVNGEIFSFEQNPTFTFMDTGLYTITLQGHHEFGCVDTIDKLVDIQPFTTFHVPNAFTPNNDGLNDEFLPKGLVDGIKEYHMSIWNRWGEEIYESNDINTGWNGQLNNNGKLLPAGVYVYTIQYSEPRGEKKSNKGHVTLIR